MFTTEDKTMFSLFTVCTRCLPRTTRRCLVCSQSVRGIYHGIQGDVQSVHSLYEVFTTDYKTVFSLFRVCMSCLPLNTRRCSVFSQPVRDVYNGLQDGVQSVQSPYELFTTEYQTMFCLFTVCTRCLAR